MNDLGEKIKQLRKERKLTQIQLAEVIGSSQSQIYKIESGLNRLYFDDAVKLSKVLDVSLDYLAGKEPLQEKKLPLWLNVIHQYDLSEIEIKELMNYIGYMLSKRN